MIARAKDSTLNINVPQKLWPLQFEAEKDFPPTSLLKCFAICTTPRCGSHFLGHQLHSVGVFGYPLEYLNPGNWPVWQRRAQVAEANTTLDFIKSVRTGPNGVFATKLHHEHLAAFIANESNPLGYQFVHLQRRDVVRQAVSFARAQMTGAWISDMPAHAPAKYNYELISAKLTDITNGNAAWNAFFASLGIEPLRVWYEDVVSDCDVAIQSIAEHLGIALPAESSTEYGFQPQIQRDTSDGEDWCDRFKADSRKVLGLRKPLPGYQPVPLSRRLSGLVPKLAIGALRRIGSRHNA